MMVNQEMEQGDRDPGPWAGLLACAKMANFLSWARKCDPPDIHVLREQRGGHGQDWPSGRGGGRSKGEYREVEL